MPILPFTPCPRGFITVHTLNDSRTLIEGWILNPDPSDGSDPRHEIAYHWITNNDDDTTATITEFTDWLSTPPTTTD